MSMQTSLKPHQMTFDHLRTSTSSQRLSQIEKIRANGVGEVVDLPQLAVCGDQSAGKSSVLEGTTGVPFPRQEGLCTRFPTEIILRHIETSLPTTISASIRPHSSRPEKEQEFLKSYRKNLQAISELPSTIEEVSRLMGLRGYTDDGNGPAFTADALRIEIIGSIGLHLSVVDLPGLISVASEEQTEEDINTVHNIAETYLQSSRTIILAVVQASNDIANQGIIKMARKYDPEGQRTVGIITKPDLINQGAEAKIARIAKNEDTIKLKLGFFLLKNPSPTELAIHSSMPARSALELRFFSTPVWEHQHLDPDRVGVDNLRRFLQHLLDTHIERELPKVQNEIRKHLKQTEAELDLMGAARQTVGEVRFFVTNLSMKFYELLQAALDGNYHTIDSDFFSEADGSRLRARVQEANTKFATAIRLKGKKRVTKSKSSAILGESDDDLPLENTQLVVTDEEMLQWVKEVYSNTRGRELPGNHNSALLAELFHEQSRPWFGIAEAHVYDIYHILLSWTHKAIKRLIPEEILRGKIDKIWQEYLDKEKKDALAELNKLMEDECRDPLTYNHYYTDNIQKSRLNMQKSVVRNAIAVVTEQDLNGKLHISNVSSDIEKFLHGLESRIEVDMAEQACKDALTQLNAYYKVAMKTFVDNVARQVIERHLVAPLPKAFAPTSVSQLSDEELLQLGSEPQHESARRARLSKMAQALRQSLLDLQKPA